jgi:hypothetical protein
MEMRRERTEDWQEWSRIIVYHEGRGGDDGDGLDGLARTFLECHHRIVYERRYLLPYLGRVRYHKQLLSLKDKGSARVTGDAVRDLRTPMAASSLRPSFCCLQSHANPNTTTTAEWIRHIQRPPHQSIPIVASLRSKLQQAATNFAHHGQRQKVCLLDRRHVKRRTTTQCNTILALRSLEEHRCTATRSSTRALDPSGSDHHTVDRSTSHQRTAMAAVASPTAQADALLAQTPTAPPAPRRHLVAPTCPLVDVLGALHLAAIPTADALHRRGTDTWHPEATATGPVLARRHL